MGRTGYVAAGDLTWIDKSLYMVGGSQYHYLIKINFNEDYSQVSSVDTVRLADGTYSIPAMATYYKNGTYKLIGLAGVTAKYDIDTATALYTIICSSSADSAYGASCNIFTTQDPTTVNSPKKKYVRVDIYPNPVLDQLNISASVQNYRVKITNVVGKLLYSGQAKSLNSTVNMQNFREGIYFVKIQDSDGEVVSILKIVKQ